MPPRKRRSKAKPTVQTVVPHPIHFLPREIIGQIFILTVDIDSATAAELHEKSRDRNGHLQIFNPLVLCAVCQSWRFLAFATPQLWQRVFINIPLNLKEAQAEKRAIDLVQWIERSRSLPLSLHISWDPRSGGFRDAPIVSVLDDYAIRWESIYFRDRHTALQLRPPPMTPLTFHSFAFLRQICNFYYMPLKDHKLPWAQVTHLKLHGYIHAQGAETIFTQCTKLVQLSISVDSSSLTFLGSIILHNLVSFSMKTPYGYLRYLLNHVSSPSLRDMFIDGVLPGDIQPLLSFFTRSSCTLDKLEICGRSLSSRDHLNVLAHRSCNSLTSLKILDACDSMVSEQQRGLVDDEVLQRLTLHHDGSLCPHLQFLTIGCSIECSPSPLLKMVESRVGSHTDQLPDEPIQHVHLQRIKCRNDFLKLDEVGKGSGMEYTHHVDQHDQYFYSFLLQKQGLQRERLLVNHGDFFFDQV